MGARGLAVVSRQSLRVLRWWWLTRAGERPGGLAAARRDGPVRRRLRLPLVPPPGPGRCSPPARSQAAASVARLSLVAVLVVAAPPHAGFVAAQWRAVEPRVHAPHRVEPAPVRGVGVVEGAVLERERAHPEPLPQVGFPVGADECLGPGVPGTFLARGRPQILLTEVVLDGSGVPRRPLVRVKPVILVDADPGQFLPLPG